MILPAKSEALFAETLKYIPGGVNSPVRAFRAVGGKPFFVKQARAQYATGSRAEAVIAIKEAIAKETDPADRKKYEGLLVMYERGVKTTAGTK